MENTMDIFWMIIALIFTVVVSIGSFYLVWIIPMKLIRRMAQKRNLQEPTYWIYSCVIITWYAPLLYYIFVARKVKKSISLDKK